MERIDWDNMNLRDYGNDVSNDKVKKNIEMILRDHNVDIEVIVNRGMFIR